MSLNARVLLLRLADSPAVKHTLTRYGFSKGIVRRFVAGETLPDALQAAQTLQSKGIRTALDFLGENVGTEAEADSAAQSYIAALDALAQAQLPDAYVSVKLTALGLDLSDALAARNLERILTAAQTHANAFVRVDMEGSAYTQRTLDIVCRAHQRFPQVGTVLQSSLYRTDEDARRLIAAGIRVRLVKGAYAEPPEVAYPRKADVDAAYVRQMQTLLLHGHSPALATHDPAILSQAKRFVRERGIHNSGFEFQMLLGIRRDLQESLAAEGYAVRAYVPFGQAWYPYFMRRLAERPANVGFILRALLRP